MKNKLIVVGVFLLSFFFLNLNVNAACGHSIQFGDESLCFVSTTTASNKEGTAQVDVQNGKIVLNNYNGGSISFMSMSRDFDIELIGDNYITAENGYGFLTDDYNINFTGNGTLTIKAKIPFIGQGINRSVDYTSSARIMTFKITPDKIENNVVVNEPDDSKENIDSTDNITDNKVEKNDNSNNESNEITESNLMIIALFVSSCISLLCLILIIVLIIKNNKLKKVSN